MGFVNELISKEDFKKYNFEELNKIRPARRVSDERTIDRDADIRLRIHDVESNHTMPYGGVTGVRTWDYFWKGVLLSVVIKKIGAYEGENDQRYRTEKINDFTLPLELESRRSEIIQDFETGLIAYNGGGTMSKRFDVNKYHYTLEV